MEQTEVIQADEVIQFLSFTVSNEEFGIDLVHVHEILRPVFITRIPNVVEHILGMINLRGEIIPIIDLKRKFDQGFTDVVLKTRIVVLEFEGKKFGLLVEEVRQVIKIYKSTISSINTNLSANFNNMIDHVGRSEDRLVLIIDLKKLVHFE